MLKRASKWLYEANQVHRSAKEIASLAAEFRKIEEEAFEKVATLCERYAMICSRAPLPEDLNSRLSVQTCQQLARYIRENKT